MLDKLKELTEPLGRVLINLDLNQVVFNLINSDLFSLNRAVIPVLHLHEFELELSLSIVCFLLLEKKLGVLLFASLTYFFSQNFHLRVLGLDLQALLCCVGCNVVDRVYHFANIVGVKLTDLSDQQFAAVRPQHVEPLLQVIVKEAVLVPWAGRVGTVSLIEGSASLRRGVDLSGGTLLRQLCQ